MWCNSNKELATFVASCPDRQFFEIACGPELTMLALPRRVFSVWIFVGHGLTSVPELPESLVHLRIINCPKLTSLPALPRSLETLWIHDCDEFVTLPALPDSLESLWVRNCDAFKGLPTLPEWCSSSGSDISCKDGSDLYHYVKPSLEDFRTSTYLQERDNHQCHFGGDPNISWT
jgi:hypothetical protein